MTHLSVNINKIATLRNARGRNYPDVLKAAVDIQQFGADGITVHPRPDERHITYKDVIDLKPLVYKEFNIEGNPREEKFIDLVLKVIPHQVTLVPDTDDQLTSDHGWNTLEHREYLQQILSFFKRAGIRTSVFVDPLEDMIVGAKETGCDRVELYTESYAKEFHLNPQQAIAPFVRAAEKAKELGLGLNAGHDLDLQNLTFFSANIPFLEEVSIGHALISDALYDGLETTVQRYKKCLMHHT